MPVYSHATLLCNLHAPRGIPIFGTPDHLYYFPCVIERIGQLDCAGCIFCMALGKKRRRPK